MTPKALVSLIYFSEIWWLELISSIKFVLCLHFNQWLLSTGKCSSWKYNNHDDDVHKEKEQQILFVILDAHPTFLGAWRFSTFDLDRITVSCFFIIGISRFRFATETKESSCSWGACMMRNHTLRHHGRASRTNHSISALLDLHLLHLHDREVMDRDTQVLHSVVKHHECLLG